MILDTLAATLGYTIRLADSMLRFAFFNARSIVAPSATGRALRLVRNTFPQSFPLKNVKSDNMPFTETQCSSGRTSNGAVEIAVENAASYGPPCLSAMIGGDRTLRISLNALFPPLM